MHTLVSVTGAAHVPGMIETLTAKGYSKMNLKTSNQC